MATGDLIIVALATLPLRSFPVVLIALDFDINTFRLFASSGELNAPIIREFGNAVKRRLAGAGLAL